MKVTTNVFAKDSWRRKSYKGIRGEPGHLLDSHVKGVLRLLASAKSKVSFEGIKKGKMGRATYLTRYMSPCGLAIKKTQGGWEGHGWPLS